MKKGWKIALISLGSLLGVVLLAAIVVLWLLFTPSQLTRIVNDLAAKYITSEVHFDKVDLTLFKTFPDAGLKIDNVYVINPIDEAPSDTVARIGNLTLGVDFKRFLKEKDLMVHQLLLDDVDASLFVNAAGESNFDIFPHSEDTTESESSFSLTNLPDMDIKKVKVTRLDATFGSVPNGLHAAVGNMDLSVVGTLREGRVDANVDIDGDHIAYTKADSTGAAQMKAALDNVELALKGAGDLEAVEGHLSLCVEKGTVNAAGTDFVNPYLQESKHDLLSLEAPFNADLDGMKFHIADGRLKVDDFALDVGGDVQLAADDHPMHVDATVATVGSWQVAPLLKIVPQKFTGFAKGMDMDAKVRLDASAVGSLTDSTFPKINGKVALADGRFYKPDMLPYKINRISADMTADIDLSANGESAVMVHSLKAHTRETDVALTGRVDDLLGDMRIDAKLKGNLQLADLRPMLPDSMPLQAGGRADVDLDAKFKMSQLQSQRFDKMLANGTVKLHNLDVTYDSVHATAPLLDVDLQLPARKFAGRFAGADISGRQLDVEMNAIKASVEKPDIHVGINNPLVQQLAAAFEVSVGESEANIDSMMVSLGALELKGSMRMDSTQSNPLRKFNPDVDIDMHSAVLYMPQLPDAIRLSQFGFQYNPQLCQIKTAEVKVGHSDFQLYGTVHNLEPWLSGEGMLNGDLNFTSNYTDVDQLMSMVSGMGSDADSLETMREEDNVPAEANPFIVPRDIDVTLHTHIKRSVAFGNDLSDVAGNLTINDGTAVLDQMGFVCKAATMQLTAIYRSPRPNNLFAAIDFHLLDIQIDELLDMIPCVDTLVPMLAAFNGNANFHLAGESYLDARYQPKMSTLLGSAAISGKDLVVLDNNSIAQIAKLMQFKSWKDADDKIRIDSLDVEMTCFRKEIEVYPFLLNIGNYQLCAAGKHSLDNKCNYHIELLKNPLLAKVGVDIKGSLSKPKISLGEVRYADLYRPEKQGVVEKRTLEMKRMIREALEANVR